ncbi:MAG: hypothetical protein J6N72_07920 [Psychrobacter sp.]|nr:hypothetical protein [Psychrobacter sp.]
MAQGRYGINSIVNGERQGEPYAVRGEFTRIKIWNAVYDSDRPLQIKEIASETKCSHAQIKSWLAVWVEHGFVERIVVGATPTGGRILEHKAMYDSEMPPLIDLKGLSKGIEHRQYAWEAIRFLGSKDATFKANDIIDSVDANYDIKIHYRYLMHYLADLHRGRYLWRKGRDFRDPIYNLQYDTGKLAPSMLRDKLIFDANLGVIINKSAK